MSHPLMLALILLQACFYLFLADDSHNFKTKKKRSAFSLAVSYA
jgi:hypothetical protein